MFLRSDRVVLPGGVQAATLVMSDGRFAEDPFGDAFLVVDGWLTLRNAFEDLEPIVIELANRGLGYGIHMIATCGRSMDMRPAIRDMFGTKLELRLGDPTDSMTIAPSR